jgi:hypothetical protein
MFFSSLLEKTLNEPIDESGTHLQRASTWRLNEEMTSIPENGLRLVFFV